MRFISKCNDFCQEKEKAEEIKRLLGEKEQETQLAIEERELQKMAALTQQDTQKDELLQNITSLTHVLLNNSSVRYLYELFNNVTFDSFFN